MFKMAVFYHRGERVWLECGVSPGFMLDQPQLDLYLRVLGEGPLGWVHLGAVFISPYLPDPPAIPLAFFKSVAYPARLRDRRRSRKPPVNLIGKADRRRFFPFFYRTNPANDTRKPLPAPLSETLSGRPWATHASGGARKAAPRKCPPDPVPF